MINPAQFLETAVNHYNKGNMPQAEAMCRHLISNDRECPQAYNLLGMVSLSIGLAEHAVLYFRKTLDIDPSHRLAKKNLTIARKETKKRKKKNKSNRRFLLIKAWGSGFWADIDHVLGQLLLAEITDRTPIIHWGKNSLYHNEISDNAFELYFEPVSDSTLDHLTTEGLSHFPPKWNQYNLRIPEINKWEGNFSRMAGLYFLGRNEDIIVSDFHTYVSDLVPWITSNNPLYDMRAQDIYRYLIEKYINLKPNIVEKINQFWSKQIKGRQVVAVHMRGSDKITESPELNKINTDYDRHIENYIANMPDIFIFLLTDSSAILDKQKQKYSHKLLYRDCARTCNNVGIHYQKHDDRKQMGVDIIMDAYIASMCDAFIGYGGTNVSTSILHLKEWANNDVTLLGDNALFQPHLFLHNR